MAEPGDKAPQGTVKPEPLHPAYPILQIWELIGGYDEATETWINNLFAPTTSP